MRILVFSTLLVLASCQEERSLGGLPSISDGFASIGSLFRSRTPSPPHVDYPVWKVHKYSGIHLRPVTQEELAASQPPERIYNEHGHLEIDGHAPQTVQVRYPSHQPDPYSFDPYAAADSETSKALAAIDSLGGFASLLPDGEQGRSLGRLKRSDELSEAEDRIGLRKRKKGLFLKKKALLALLKGSPGVGKLGGLAGLGGLGGFSGFSFGNLFGSSSGDEEVEVSFVPEVTHSDSHGPYPAAHSGPYPAAHSGPYPAAHSGSYPASSPGHTTVFRTPSHTPGFFEGWFGGRNNDVLAVELPEPSLPELPQLELVPEAPKLPRVTLPGNYKAPFSTGSYVSIKVPKPSFSHQIPAAEYGPPAAEYGPPAAEYGPPAAEYGPPAAEYGPPPVQYGPPSAEYGPPSAVPLPVFSSHSDVFHGNTFDNVGFQQHANEHFLPSEPAPPVYNAYQGQVSSYQAPVQEYSQAPPPVATAVYNYYPPPQGYDYFDNSHSSSEHKTTILTADKRDSVDAARETENPLNAGIAKEIGEQQLPETTKEQEEPARN